MAVFDQDRVLKISISNEVFPAGEGRVSLSGQLTWPHIKQFQAEMVRLLQSGVRVLEIDLGALSYMDSAGLAAFLPVQQLFANAGGRIKILNARKFIHHLFVSSHLDTVIEFVAEARTSA